MAALAPITINDGLTTPVAHTFNPSKVTTEGTAKYFDRVLGSAVLFGEIHISLYEPKRVASRVKDPILSELSYKAVVKVMIPKADITSPTTGTGIQPAPSKAYDALFVGTFTLPARSDVAARKDLLAYVKNLLATTVVTSLVQDLESVY